MTKLLSPVCDSQRNVLLIIVIYYYYYDKLYSPITIAVTRVRMTESPISTVKLRGFREPFVLSR